MPTLVERQIALELESVILGKNRYDERLKDQGLTSTRPGEEQATRALPVLVEAIEEFLDAAHRGDRALRRSVVVPYLVQADPRQTAYLALRYALDGAAAGNRATDIAMKIGTALQDHVALMGFADGDAREDKDEAKHMRRLFRKVLEQAKLSQSPAHRRQVWNNLLRKYSKRPVTWSRPDLLHVGMKLIELATACTNLFVLEKRSEGRHDTPYYLTFTEEAAEWFAASHLKASLWEPVHQPMLVPPTPWTTPYTGGYYTSGLAPEKRAMPAKLVKTSVPGLHEELRNVLMPNVYDAINAVQATPWRVNDRVLYVMLEAWGMPRFQHLFAPDVGPAPLRPSGVPEAVPLDQLPLEQREAIVTWKRSIARHHQESARADSKRSSAAQTLSLAKKFAGEKVIYFPQYLDFRGRMYPFASHLSPQGDDKSRGLLEFSEGRALGERGGFWLKVHLANLFGVDKVAFSERVAWVEKNHDQLVATAIDPIGNTFWMTADDGKNAWQALAACMEYAGYTVQGDEFVSHLSVGMDGSCSGLQHYSAMLRDVDGARQVNLLPAEKPADIYTAVAKRAQVVMDRSVDDAAQRWKGGKIVRKVAKQPTMTYCYSASQYGMAGQIEAAVNKMGAGDYLTTENEDVRRCAVYAAGVVRDAIEETVVAAKEAMDFLKACAKVAADEGLPIRWTAPSGFPVVQAYRTAEAQRVPVMYQGLRMKLVLQREGTDVDRKRQTNGVAPNFVHACDSSHLMATVLLGEENGLHNWAMIHDSFGVHAADVDVLHNCIRETFIEQYTPHVLAQFREEIAEQLPPEAAAKLPPVPTQGDLELEQVREAAYFFA